MPSTYAKTGDAAAAALQANRASWSRDDALVSGTKDPMQLLREKGNAHGQLRRRGEAAGNGTSTQTDQIERMVRGNAVSRTTTKVQAKHAGDVWLRQTISTPLQRPERLAKKFQTGVQSATVRQSRRLEAWKEVQTSSRDKRHSPILRLWLQTNSARRLSTSTPKAIEWMRL